MQDITHPSVLGMQLRDPEKEQFSPQIKQQQILLFILENWANEEGKLKMIWNFMYFFYASKV